MGLSPPAAPPLRGELGPDPGALFDDVSKLSSPLMGLRLREFGPSLLLRRGLPCVRLSVTFSFNRDLTFRFESDAVFLSGKLLLSYCPNPIGWWNWGDTL